MIFVPVDMSGVAVIISNDNAIIELCDLVLSTHSKIVLVLLVLHSAHGCVLLLPLLPPGFLPLYMWPDLNIQQRKYRFFSIKR